MSTREKFHFAFNGLSVAEFGRRTSQSAAQVRKLIATGWFNDLHMPDGRPACIDIADFGAKMPRFKINPGAVEKYLTERSQPREYPKRERKSAA